MKPQLSALVLAVAALFAGDVEAMSDAELRALVEQRFAGDRTGACVAVAVIDGDAVVRSFVCADPAQLSRVGADTAFEIGSVSKTMTAALLAELIVQGKASLDDRLADWLPGTTVPQFQGQPILLRHLVTHTSGLPALPPGVALADMNNPYAKITVADLLAALERTPLARAPGAQTEYSNFAMMLLSAAIAQRSGQALDVLLRERLFAPLGMDTAHVGAAPAGVRVATGHTPNTQPTSPWDFAPDVAGVGGVRATLDDMVAYVQAELGKPASTLDPVLALTQQPVVTAAGDGAAMNWFFGALPAGKALVHEGGTGGFSSFVGFDRARGRGVIVLSDTAVHSLGGLGSVGLHLLDPSLPLGAPRKAVPAPAEVMDGLAGRWQLQGAMAVTLRRDGDKLFIHPDGQPEFELGHDSEGDFYPLAFDALLKPQRLPGGGWGFSWLQMGGVMAATRLDAAPAVAAAPTLSAEQLRDYAGDYPLVPGFALKVFEKDGKLFVQGTGQQPIPAEAAAADVFVIAQVGAELRFSRDGGRVVALELLQNGQRLRGERQ